jgi:anthranilate phosphoribosyltransferase
MGVRTIFNILGPLTNPAGAPNTLMGVFHPDLVGIQVRVMQRLGADHVMVVWGKDGMDEISLGAATLVGELKNGEISEYEIHPEDFGLQMVSNRGLRVADARRVEGDGAGGARQHARHAARDRHAECRRRALCGQHRRLGRRRHRRAREAIASGAARAKLDAVRRLYAALQMSDILQKILAVKREEVAAAQAAKPLAACAPRRKRSRRRATSSAPSAQKSVAAGRR